MDAAEEQQAFPTHWVERKVVERNAVVNGISRLRPKARPVAMPLAVAAWAGCAFEALPPALAASAIRERIEALQPTFALGLRTKSRDTARTTTFLATAAGSLERGKKRCAPPRWKGDEITRRRRSALSHPHQQRPCERYLVTLAVGPHASGP
jgi:hypothetical protein